MVLKERVRALLALHGAVRSQPVEDWRGTFPIPNGVGEFYREVGPVSIRIEAHGNPYFIPSLAELWSFQAGYRWNGVSGEPVEWDDNWLVVADEGGDPFILERSTGSIFHAHHGAGKWNARKTFPNLYAMAGCLAQLGALVRESNGSYMDEGCSIRLEYVAKATELFQEFLGTRTEAIVALEALGWA